MSQPDDAAIKTTESPTEEGYGVAVRFVEASRLPTDWGVFMAHGFEDEQAGKEHLVLTLGNLASPEPVLTRLHSECLTGDALFSRRCDCGEQLQASLRAIAMEGRGALLYLRQEGRGIGLINKIRAYNLQDSGADTVEANQQLGFGADLRDYSIVLPMFEHLGFRRIRLMTNNPRKVSALEELGIEIVERIPLVSDSNPHNEQYLRTKSSKLGHIIAPVDSENST